MSNITLQIGTRSYTVACAAGEEDHVRALGQVIADKVQSLGSSAQGDAQTLLFAALLMADELHEARQKGVAAPSVPAASAMNYSGALEAIALRLETCASALEQQGNAPYIEQ